MLTSQTSHHYFCLSLWKNVDGIRHWTSTLLTSFRGLFHNNNCVSFRNNMPTARRALERKKGRWRDDWVPPSRPARRCGFGGNRQPHDAAVRGGKSYRTRRWGHTIRRSEQKKNTHILKNASSYPFPLQNGRFYQTDDGSSTYIGV
jgi:hypothetical protein